MSETPPVIDGFGITCLECGRTFKRFMGPHAWAAHGLLKHDYYRKHKLPLGSRLATNEYRREVSNRVKEQPGSRIRGAVPIKDTADAVRIAKTLPNKGYRNTKGRPLTPGWKSKVVAASKRTGKLRHERAHEERACKYCGKSFLALMSHNPQFCSNPCRGKALGPANSKRLSHPIIRAKANASIRRRSATKRKTISCEVCGKEKNVLKVRQTRFCSQKCFGIAKSRNKRNSECHPERAHGNLSRCTIRVRNRCQYK